MPTRLLLAALLCAAASAAAFDLQGHRGARGLAPENTLPAFAAALSLGVDTLELDTLVTKDGVVVVHHDRDLNPATTRGADGKWLAARGPLVRTLDYADLARYDVGRLNPEAAYAKNYPQQRAVDGTRVPRLADVFELVKKSGNARVRFNIETKLSPVAGDSEADATAHAQALLDAVRAAGMVSRVAIQSFDWRSLQAVQRLAPGIPTVYLSAQQKWLDNIGVDAASGSPWVAGFQYKAHGSVPRMVKAAGGAVWSPFHGDVDAQRVIEARSMGLKVVVWTVNDPAAIRAMLDLGVDGIISDRPDLVRAAMAERGMPLPPSTPVTP